MPDNAAAAGEPPFYRYAAKFVAALAAAIVGASATILAAFDDGHVTPREWAAVVLGVLAGAAGPAAVYAVRNATGAAAARVTALSRVSLPGGGYLIVKEALSGAQVDQLTAALEQGHGQPFRANVAPVDGSAAAARAYPPANPWDAPQ